MKSSFMEHDSSFGFQGQLRTVILMNHEIRAWESVDKVLKVNDKDIDVIITAGDSGSSVLLLPLCPQCFVLVLFKAV